MTVEPFEHRTRVLFQHCDPAGIVFFPRWFEMLNEVVEAFWADVLGCDFRELHLERGLAVPAIRTEADYRSPGQLNEWVTWKLWVTALGGSSIDFRIDGVGADGAVRVAFRHRIVFAENGPPLKAKRLPDDYRRRAEAYLEADGDV